MQLGFIGHNGFAIGSADKPVLLDAILESRYGAEYTSSPVEVYPPRKFNYSELPDPAALIISHEHSDHFHLPSISKIPRSTPVVVGPTMIEAVKSKVSQLGFEVLTLPFGETMDFAGTLITLYPAGNGTVLWESRVSQVLAQDANDPDMAAIYLSIDALISDQYIQELDTGERPYPTAIAVSNNAQIAPSGIFGSLDNMRSADLNSGSGEKRAFDGLRILDGIIVETARSHHAFREAHFLVCGGGFLKDYEKMGPFPFSEQKTLAENAQRLTHGSRTIVGPEPGDVLEVSRDGLTITGAMSWVSVDWARLDELKARREQFILSGDTVPLRRIRQPADAEQLVQYRTAILNEFEYLAKSILLSPFGSALHQCYRSTNQLAPFVLHLLWPDVDESWEFRIDDGAFTHCGSTDLAEDMERYAFGLVVHGEDLAAVFGGDLQIWDVVGIAMRSWFAGERMQSPVAHMYDAYGEQVRPEIACRVFDAQLAVMGGS